MALIWREEDDSKWWLSEWGLQAEDYKEIVYYRVTSENNVILDQVNHMIEKLWQFEA